MENVKVGGQALGDGVLMRTDRAWAIARADGSVEVGAVRMRRTAGVPVVRVIAALGGALRLAVGRGLLGRGSGRGFRGANRRFLWALAGAELFAVAFTMAVDGVVLTGAAAVAIRVAPWLATLLLLRVISPQTLWRYHGAEHKAVAALEAGVDLNDVESVLRSPRVHNRCGTNLVWLLMVLAVPLGAVPAVLQVPAFLLGLGAAAEIIAAAARRPAAVASRLLLGGGRALQYWVTTAEPTPAEQGVGCRALLACLAEHTRLAAGAPVIWSTWPSEVAGYVLQNEGGRFGVTPW